MGNAHSTACRLALMAAVLGAFAGCGGDQDEHDAQFPPPPHLELANDPANEKTASPTEVQAGSAEAPAPESPPSEPPADPTPVAVAPTPPSPAAEPVRAPAPAHDFDGEPRPRAVPLAVPDQVKEIVDAIDRYDSDRDLDAGRHPGELLALMGLSRGMQVGELMAGRGYTTELLARTVGPTGKVWAENPAPIVKTAGRAFNERLSKTVMENVSALALPADAPFPAGVKDLDAVVDVLGYHDAVGYGVDRDKMNKAVFEALKSGGQYVIVDHSAAPGRGIQDVKTLHRIEESVVVREVLRAGFQRPSSANFLRNPDDSRDWNDSPAAAGDRRGTSDRFVLKFVRP
jgi:predicted methyltransferase